MKKMSLFLASAFLFSFTAQAGYVLNCVERNGEETKLITNAGFDSDSVSYDVNGLASVDLPVIGDFEVNSNPDVILSVIQPETDSPWAHSLVFVIQTDDSRHIVDLQDVYNIRFGRMSTTVTFDALLTHRKGDLGDGSAVTYNASCDLMHL